MINSLTARIFAIFWFTLALVLMIALMAPKLDSRQLAPLLDNEYQLGKKLAKQIEEELIQNPRKSFWWINMLDAINLLASPNEYLLLVTYNGNIINPDPTSSHYQRQAIRNFIGQSDNADHPKKKKYGRSEILGPFSVLDDEEHYLLYLIRPASSPQSDFINLMFDRPFLLPAATMLISAPLLLWLAWSLAKPARKLKNAADDVAKGNLRQHPELESGPQEFLATGSSFNHMISALERMVTAQQRLISDISHELRTPLTRLQLATALLRRHHGESKELARIETETQRLDGMINDLLILSRHQHKNELLRENIKAYDLWHDILENAKFEVEQMHKTLDIVSPPGNWVIYCNPATLGSALENIVRNALRYSSSHIAVAFKADNQGVTITVDDDGPGVSPEDREHIFRPFYRTDEARDRESGGTGLGLAIVEAAVNQHRGWAKAEDSPLGGLRLVIWLPLHGR
ncbi:envelope stress sensor histidine kinase CpxA [Xenorhabdus sp. XENO-10]|uniref:histidine kinase n=1 Tax=Xenorhabdus yunnanensis TaxID=3025878 RepID=A0ABT5LBW6_9GAMM|nr:envelope stress sensor histidine kinase CpxA [Xenorhabdus yunnanensis]MDC9588581.1 envelope stress sensor histidine kinase CpxA [Xenorhabdus yunnanensis]